MSKQVVTKVEYTYGSISGNVNYISVSTGWALDSEDLECLKKDIAAQLASKDRKIEELEEKILKIEQQNELLIKVFKESMDRFERDNSDLVNRIINISEDTKDHVLQMLLKKR